jgi:hypothetical protein
MGQRESIRKCNNQRTKNNTLQFTKPWRRGYKRTQGLPKKDEHPKSFGKRTLKTKIIDSQEFLLHVGLICFE